MKRIESIKQNYEFRRIYAKGKSAARPHMAVYTMKNRRGKSRIGITVSTKVGNAVVRNRIRRRLREIYRLNTQVLQPGTDIIIVARGKSKSATYAQLQAEYLRLIDKLGCTAKDEKP